MIHTDPVKYVKELVKGSLKIDSFKSANPIENGWIELHDAILIEDTDNPVRKVQCLVKSMIIQMVDVGPKDQYLRLIHKLLVLRTKPEYTVELECEYLDKLDALWNMMSEEEQQLVNEVH